MEKQRNKEILQLKLSMPKFYATLWETKSFESKEEDLDQDPNVLCNTIRKIRLTAIHGVSWQQAYKRGAVVKSKSDL